MIMEAPDDVDDEMLLFLRGREQVGVIMAEEVQGDDDEIFVYTGGNQQVPLGVRRARIHKDVKIVRAWAFYNRRQLISVEFHDGVEIVEEDAFRRCYSLRSIKLLGVRIIKNFAFFNCESMTAVEFGDKLETTGKLAFAGCYVLRNISMPSARVIGNSAFSNCCRLTNVECGEGLRSIQLCAFNHCDNLERIALPLKSNMFGDNAFDGCEELTTVDLVGGIHKTVASLHMESWRSEMTGEINRINQILPITNSFHKTGAIQQWMESVINRLDRYKEEHRKLLKEATTLLELALWKASLSDHKEGEGSVRAAGEVESSRDEIPYTSGAEIVIKNVLQFLALK